ncbi:hypothetical protein ACJJTC_003037 [Scirpophaga incertulas]
MAHSIATHHVNQHIVLYILASVTPIAVVSRLCSRCSVTITLIPIEPEPQPQLAAPEPAVSSAPSKATALANGSMPFTSNKPSRTFSEVTERPVGAIGEMDVTSKGPLNTTFVALVGASHLPLPVAPIVHAPAAPLKIDIDVLAQALAAAGASGGSASASAAASAAASIAAGAGAAAAPAAAGLTAVGEGQLSAAGAVSAAGSALVKGALPATGAVAFDGKLPAAGSVSSSATAAAAALCALLKVVDTCQSWITK